MNEKKLKVYFDNSVIGGYFDEEFQEPTKLLFKFLDENKIIGYFSSLTKQEADAYINNPLASEFDKLFQKLTQVNLNDEIRRLADEYMQQGVLTKKSINDCLHVAIATFYDFEIIVSWNFKHLVNIDKIPKFNLINFKLGYKQIQICTPGDIVYGLR